MDYKDELSKADIDMMLLVAADEQKGGRVSWDSFLNQFDPKDEDEEDAERGAAWNMLSQDSDEITIESIKDFLEKLGEKLSEEELAELLEIADVDSNGKISHGDFVVLNDDKQEVPGF